MNKLRRIFALLAIAAFATPITGMAAPNDMTSAAAGHCADSGAPDTRHVPHCDHGPAASCPSMSSCLRMAALEATAQDFDGGVRGAPPAAVAAELPASAPRAPETPPPRA